MTKNQDIKPILLTILPLIDDPKVTFVLHEDCERLNGFLLENPFTRVYLLGNNTAKFEFIGGGTYVPRQAIILGVKQVGTITHKQLMRMHRHRNFHNRFHK